MVNNTWTKLPGIPEARQPESVRIEWLSLWLYLSLQICALRNCSIILSQELAPTDTYIVSIGLLKGIEVIDRELGGSISLFHHTHNESIYMNLFIYHGKGTPHGCILLKIIPQKNPSPDRMQNR